MVKYTGLAIGGSKNGQFLKSDDYEIRVFREIDVSPYFDFNAIPDFNATHQDERYIHTVGLRGNFEIDFWLLAGERMAAKDALRKVFQFYADNAKGE